MTDFADERKCPHCDEQLEQTVNVFKCWQCGYKQVFPEEVSCTVCGALDAYIEQEQWVFCKTCGNCTHLYEGYIVVWEDY